MEPVHDGHLGRDGRRLPVLSHQRPRVRVGRVNVEEALAVDRPEEREPVVGRPRHVVRPVGHLVDVADELELCRYDQPDCLIEPFVVVLGMLPRQDVAQPVVLPQEQRVHRQHDPVLVCARIPSCKELGRVYPGAFPSRDSHRVERKVGPGNLRPACGEHLFQQLAALERTQAFGHLFCATVQHRHVHPGRCHVEVLAGVLLRRSGSGHGRSPPDTKRRVKGKLGLVWRHGHVDELGRRVLAPCDVVNDELDEAQQKWRVLVVERLVSLEEGVADGARVGAVSGLGDAVRIGVLVIIA